MPTLSQALQVLIGMAGGAIIGLICASIVWYMGGPWIASIGG